jgi:hypothetical protein
MTQLGGFAICEPYIFAICGPNYFSRINRNNVADLQFADWLTSEICGLAIAE